MYSDRVEKASGGQFSAALLMGRKLSIFFTLSGALWAKITDFRVFFFFPAGVAVLKTKNKNPKLQLEFFVFGVLVIKKKNLIFLDFGSKSSRTG
jgi:hypothetical protein